MWSLPLYVLWFSAESSMSNYKFLCPSPRQIQWLWTVKKCQQLVKFSLYGQKRPHTLYPNQISVSLPSQNQLSRQNLCCRAYDWVTTPNVTTSNLTNHCARCSTCSFEHFMTSVINKGTDNRQLYATCFLNKPESASRRADEWASVCVTM